MSATGSPNNQRLIDVLSDYRARRNGPPLSPFAVGYRHPVELGWSGYWAVQRRRLAVVIAFPTLVVLMPVALVIAIIAGIVLLVAALIAALSAGLSDDDGDNREPDPVFGMHQIVNADQQTLAPGHDASDPTEQNTNGAEGHPNP